MAKLYPPQLEGSLPAFSNTYDANDKNRFLSTTLRIPFGLNRAVSVNSIKNIAIKIRTTSTNTFLVSDYLDIQHNLETGVAVFSFTTKEKIFNESQYYRVQIAFVDYNDVVGYYSTVGIIKCITKPSAIVNNYNAGDINMFNTTFYGIYTQDLTFGDSTEKAYSYVFNIYDNSNNLLLTSGEKIHDATQDTSSNSSQDFWQIYSEFNSDEIYYLEYIVTTLNGYIVSSPKYKIMKVLSIPVEYNIKLRADNHYDDGYIEISFEGEFDENPELREAYYQLVDPTKDYDPSIIYFLKQNNEYSEFDGSEDEWNYFVGERAMYIRVESIVYGETAYSGNFVITRSSIDTNFTEWVEIARFSIQNQKPSTIYHRDKTVEQGKEYKYALQQYNIHDIYSDRVYQTHTKIDIYGKEYEVEDTTIADFEHIFISDGTRQLKVSYNSKIKSFKTTIPEKKVETIGSKYPFIFRNGSVSYKEFSLSGLISYQSDTAQLFLTNDECIEAGLLEYNTGRTLTSKDIYYTTKVLENDVEKNIYFMKVETPIYDPETNEFLYTEIKYVMVHKPTSTLRYKVLNLYQTSVVDRQDIFDDDLPTLMRTDTNLTSENFLGERYFRLKVLDWLNNGTVKLFRSPTEGNYLVRILNVSLTPEEKLSRLLYNFSATLDEIDDISFDNLVKYGLVNISKSEIYENQWQIVNVKQKLKEANLTIDSDGFVLMTPDNLGINDIMIQHFAPGDAIKIDYDEDGSNIFVIGTTGSLEVNDDKRNIVAVWVKINSLLASYDDFERELIYSYSVLAATRFDAISDLAVNTKTAEQIVGPKDNLLDSFNLKLNCYGVPNADGIVKVRIPQETGVQNIYNALTSNNYFNYNIEELSNSTVVEKYKVTKIEILHVHKRDVIPVFAYKTGTINNSTYFGMTPFNQGYVNNQPILNYLIGDSQLMNYNVINSSTDNIETCEDIVQIDENGNYYNTGKISIYDINTLSEIYTTNNDSLSIFKIYVWNNDMNIWEESTTPGYKYYDNYTHQWWADGEEYNPSFSINELDEFDEFVYDSDTNIIKENYDHKVIGDNNIYLNELNDILLYNLGDVSVLKLGNGVYAEITYQLRTIDYDLEGSNYEVRDAKRDYLNTLDDYSEQLDTVLDALSQKDQLLSEKEIVEGELEIVNYQLSLANNTASYSVVQQAAKERIIEQKEKLWDHREKAAQEIADFLLNYKLYADIDIQPPVNVLKDYTITEDNESVVAYSTLIENRIKNIKDNKAALDDIFSDETTGGIIFNTLPYPIVQNKNIFYDFIHDSTYIDVEYYTQQKQYYEEVIANYENQITELQSQQGKLVGGYDVSLYDDLNMPPEHTIIYYDYLLDKANKQYANELLALTKSKADLVNQLLSLNLNQTGNLLTTIQDATATYLVDNADKLISLLTSYRNHNQNKINTLNNSCFKDLGSIIYKVDNLSYSQRTTISAMLDGTISDIVVNVSDNGQNIYSDPTTGKIYEQIITLFTPTKTLEALYQEINSNDTSNLKLKNYLTTKFANIAAYCKSYDLYSLEIKIEINTLDTAISILNGIKANPGLEGRNYNLAYQERNYPFTSIANTFNQQIAAIRDNYINVSETAINDWLSNNSYDIKNLLFITQEIDANDKAFAILDLFTDRLNESQITNIKKYLNNYYPAPTTNNAKDLVQQIKYKDVLYADKTERLQQLKATYTDARNLIQDEIDNLDKVISEINKREKQVRKNLNTTNNQLLLAEQLKNVIESEYFFENILVKNQKLINNFTSLNNYLSWLKLNQDNLINQLGQLNDNVHTGEQYGDFIKSFIDAYELEAFDFLHKYTAIEEDLGLGFEGLEMIDNNPVYSPGMDRYKYDLSHYFLSAYKDILYLVDEEVEGQAQHYLDLISSDEYEDRLQGYNELKDYLSNIFLSDTPSDMIVNYELGVLMSPNNTNDQIVILEHSSSKESQYYPKIRTLGATSQVITSSYEDGSWILPDGYYLLRYPLENKTRSFINVDNYYSNNTYHKNPYQRDGRVYLKENSDLDYQELVFNQDDLSDEEFDTQVKYYKSIGKSLVWLTDEKPITCSVKLYKFICDTNIFNIESKPVQNLDFYENLNLNINVSDQFLIQPQYYYSYFKNFLGKIVHDVNSNYEEQGSYYKILESSLLSFDLIAAYFHIWKSIHLESSIESDNEYDFNNIRNVLNYLTNLETNLATFKQQRDYWNQIITNSEFTLDGYKIQEDINSIEIEQLEAIIAEARSKKNYYIDLISQWQEEIKYIKNTNLVLKEYIIAKEANEEILNTLSHLYTDINNDLNVYKKKCDHYLKLLFNDIPFGITIDKNIISRNNILTINNDDTSTYNYGLAYSIERYKKYFGDSRYSQVDFSNIIVAAKDFEEKLYKYFPLINLETSLEASYEFGKYFSKLEDGTYIAYNFLDKTKWQNDLQNQVVYYTNYPNLCDFINYYEYFKVNAEDNFDSEKKYYRYTQNKYSPVTLTNEDDFNIVKSSLYFRGNGGLTRILHDLSGTTNETFVGKSFSNNPYLTEIKNIYYDTINLYHKLLTQIRGDALADNNLLELKYDYETRLTEINNILVKLSGISTDKEAMIREIYEKLAYYLYLLTVVYMDNVERSYDAV